MHPSQQVSIHQQKRVEAQARGADSYTFFNLLTSPEFIEQIEWYCQVEQHELNWRSNICPPLSSGARDLPPFSKCA